MAKFDLVIDDTKIIQQLTDIKNSFSKTLDEVENTTNGINGSLKKTVTSLTAIPQASGSVIKKTATEVTAIFKLMETDLSRASLAADLFKKELSKLDQTTDEAKELSNVIESIESNLNQLGDTKAPTSLRSQISALRNELSTLEAAGLDNTEVYRKLSIQAGQLTDQYGDLQARIKVLSSDTKNIDFGISVIQSAISVVQIYEGTLTTLGLSTEEVQKQTARLTALLNIANGVQQIANVLQKESVLRIVAADKATKLLAAAQAIYTSVVNTSILSLRAFTIALAATGIGAFAAGLVIAYQAYQKFAAQNEKANQAIKLNNELVKESASAYASAKVEVSTMAAKIDLAKNGLLDKNIVLAEYNDSLGKAIGSATSLSEAEQLIIDKGDEYIQIQFLKAKANAAAALASKELEKSLEAQNKSELEFAGLIDKAQLAVGDFIGSITGVGIRDQDIVDRALSNQKEQIVAFENNAESLLKIQESTIAEASKLAKKSNIVLDPNIKLDKQKTKEKVEKTLTELQEELRLKIIEFQNKPSDKLALEIQKLDVNIKDIQKSIKDAKDYVSNLLRLDPVEVPVTIEPKKTKDIAIKTVQDLIKEFQSTTDIGRKLEISAEIKTQLESQDRIKDDLQFVQDVINGQVDPTIPVGVTVKKEEIKTAKDFIKKEIETLFGGSLSADEFNKITDLATTIFDNLENIISSAFDAQIEKQQSIIDKSEEQLASLNDQLLEQQELAKEGEANNVDALKQQIAEEKKIRDKAVKDQEAAQKKKFALDTSTQLSSLLTASANIWLSTSSILPPFGTILAIGTIASMFASFAAARATARDAAGFYDGGHTGDGNPREVAGVVHKAEFVSDHETTAAHRPLLEGLHEDNREKLRTGLKQLLLDYNFEPSELFNTRISTLAKESNPIEKISNYILSEILSQQKISNKRLETLEKRAKVIKTPLGDGRVLIESDNKTEIKNYAK